MTAEIHGCTEYGFRPLLCGFQETVPYERIYSEEITGGIPQFTEKIGRGRMWAAAAMQGRSPRAVRGEHNYGIQIDRIPWEGSA